MSFEIPSNDPLTDENRVAFRTWLQWLSRVHTIATSLQQSGPTADRPTSVLWLGRRYFDTDLGIPVWVQSVRPTVWVDATGGAV